MADLKLGLAQGYWGAAPNPNFVEMAQEAEKLGYDSVWSAEAWGNDVCCAEITTTYSDGTSDTNSQCWSFLFFF